VYAALIEYPRYIDPETGSQCEVERLMSHLALQRRMRERFPAIIYAIGFSFWKKTILRSFLWGSEIRFVGNASKVPEGATLAIWGRKPIRGELAAGIQILQIEDGFLRSVGLGADLVKPLSWVIDRQGIYYDASQPSGLEQLLQATEFEPELIERARGLREGIVSEGVTKYNVGASSWARPTALEAGTRVVLVPGQVESDASVRYGTARIRNNLELLREVRRLNPGAWIVYKPHPDVIAGLRKPGVGEADVSEWCDEVLGDVPMQVLLDAVDEVHVLTSLAGFEALLRGKAVVTYGQPFYAGWGLTRDISVSPEVAQRRGRQLSLDELVAATLILYPTYVSRTTDRFTTPEQALSELLAWRKRQVQDFPLWRKTLRLILRTLKVNG
jgi:capsular polysaccharide export protein